MFHKFEFEELACKGAYAVTPQYMEDERGEHIKDYHRELFLQQGIDHDIKEIFYTVSKKGVVRALHYQKVRQQAKLVRCIKGRVYDVIVDLRKQSETYLKWAATTLSEENKKMIYVPSEFAHGYLVLEDAIVSYYCAEKFYKEYDTGIRWNDPRINIEWPYELVGGKEKIILSEKDRNLPFWTE